MLLVLQALVAALTAAEVRPRAVAACTGASTALPADQCAAWQAFWDDAGGDKGWTGYGRRCTRTDPCKQGCGANPICNGAGTTVTQFYMYNSNLKGTISPLIGAFVDITLFEVTGNDLSGTVPASLGNWRKIKYFSVNGNRFSGALPAMSFGTMTRGGYLLDDPATNSFACPWPAGATAVCTKKNNGTDVPITDSDCHVTAPTPAPTPGHRDQADKDSNVGAIAGGASALLALVAVGVALRTRRCRTMQASESANTDIQLNSGFEDANDDAVPAVADPTNAI